ncbi:pyrroline-5-carboxylate reductase [Rickettsiella endosymbiont of Dermanyssus gallinae]|uniref:pyrroline-5-carboxylate reductase n=1 Tax=Rickettsiella endosymbiont of Dermanyssus gallinae TaxID=2856608 RepID=UPI001C52CC73|nr:pyrroline-5-carboxylate reductase [Rickettsiella endosymbiont of Dermanyssus gallinae]
MIHEDCELSGNAAENSSAKRIAFIGAGNMANSLIRGLLNNGYDANNIWASNTNLALLEHLKKLKIHTSTDNRLVATTAEVLVLAVKPQILKEVVTEITDLILEKKPLLISLAVGVNLKTIHSYLQDDNIAIIRCMPNTPALLGCGATGLFPNHHCSSVQKDAAEALFRSVGIVVWCKLEKEIDIVAALSGSGPAYFFLLIEALQNAGTELGLSKETASLLSQQTALGAARMAIESEGKESIEQLRQNVTSRGGTTQAALNVLEQGHFAELMKKAMLAAKQRAEELAKQLENQ